MNNRWHRALKNVKFPFKSIVLIKFRKEKSKFYLGKQNEDIFQQNMIVECERTFFLLEWQSKCPITIVDEMNSFSFCSP